MGPAIMGVRQRVRELLLTDPSDELESELQAKSKPIHTCLPQITCHNNQEEINEPSQGPIRYQRLISLVNSVDSKFRKRCEEVQKHAADTLQSQLRQWIHQREDIYVSQVQDHVQHFRATALQAAEQRAALAHQEDLLREKAQLQEAHQARVRELDEEKQIAANKRLDAVKTAEENCIEASQLRRSLTERAATRESALEEAHLGLEQAKRDAEEGLAAVQVLQRDVQAEWERLQVERRAWEVAQEDAIAEVRQLEAALVEAQRECEAACSQRDQLETEKSHAETCRDSLEQELEASQQEVQAKRRESEELRELLDAAAEKERQRAEADEHTDTWCEQILRHAEDLRLELSAIGREGSAVCSFAKTLGTGAPTACSAPLLQAVAEAERRLTRVQKLVAHAARIHQQLQEDVRARRIRTIVNASPPKVSLSDC